MTNPSYYILKRGEQDRGEMILYVLWNDDRDYFYGFTNNGCVIMVFNKRQCRSIYNTVTDHWVLMDRDAAIRHLIRNQR